MTPKVRKATQHSLKRCFGLPLEANCASTLGCKPARMDRGKQGAPRTGKGAHARRRCAQRCPSRELPMVRVDKDYAFASADSTAPRSLADLSLTAWTSSSSTTACSGPTTTVAAAAVPTLPHPSRTCASCARATDPARLRVLRGPGQARGLRGTLRLDVSVVLDRGGCRKRKSTATFTCQSISVPRQQRRRRRAACSIFGSRRSWRPWERSRTRVSTLASASSSRMRPARCFTPTRLTEEEWKGSAPSLRCSTLRLWVDRMSQVDLARSNSNTSMSRMLERYRRVSDESRRV